MLEENNSKQYKKLQKMLVSSAYHSQKENHDMLDFNPYDQGSGPPRMLRSFVCYADILGYTSLSEKAIGTGHGGQFLNRLRLALSRAYERIRNHAELYGGRNLFAIKCFTDNIVVGYPLRNPEFGYGEPEFGHVLQIFAELQAGLAMEGFFVRGGIACGDHYMDKDIVFGNALLDAVKLDKSGGPPRLALHGSALDEVRKQLDLFYPSAEHSLHYHELLQDADGTLFINYLNEAFAVFPEGGVFYDLIEDHKLTVNHNLEKYRTIPDIRAKYEWAACYHNFVCREFAEMNAASSAASPDDDEFCALAEVEAQNAGKKILEYLIDFDSLAASPCRFFT